VKEIESSAEAAISQGGEEAAAIASKLNITEDSARYVLNRLAQQGKITLRAEPGAEIILGMKFTDGDRGCQIARSSWLALDPFRHQDSPIAPEVFLELSDYLPLDIKFT